MANLAIKGHPTRGKEVIQILEMLGGKNPISWNGSNQGLFHYVDVKGEIDAINDTSKYLFNYTLYTIDAFLEEFPYKVGDKVIAFNEKCSIANAFWDKERSEVLYLIHIIQGGYVRDVSSCEIKPYKEEV